jgi:hypothetical protein
MRNKLFLYIPLLYILSIFFLDKIFSIDFFKKNFLQTGNVIYYKHREILYEQYKNYLSNPKNNSKINIIAMGDSRAYAYSSLGLTKERKDKYQIYNFSAPQAVVAYSLFWLERFIQDKKSPHLVFLVLSPEGFDDSKGLMHKPFIRLGANEEFIERYKDQIPSEDLREYYLDKLIVLRKLELNFKLLVNRLKSKKMKEYIPAYNPEMQLLMLTNGEQLAYTTSVNDISKLEKESFRMEKVYLKNYTINDTQFFFLEKFLSTAKENKISVILIFPKIYPTYLKAFEKMKITTNLLNRFQTLANKYNTPLVNWNESSNCELFYDASHQSTLCFGEQLQFLLDIYEKNLIQD